MQKQIMLIVFVVVSFTAFGQAQQAQRTNVAHCKITELVMAHASRVEVDFGLYNQTMTDTYLKNGSGHVLVFRTMIDAMNHLIDRGWEFVQVYGTSTPDQITDICILKRTFAQMTKDELEDHRKDG